MKSHGISGFSYEEALKKREEEGRDSLFQPISLKDCKLPGNILMAPMAGVTDLPYRILCKEMGLSLSFTEMVSAKAIYYGNQNTDSLLEHKGEPGLVSAQLFGSDPALMAEMACRIEEDFDGIDVNMGCPVPKVVRNQEGSALMTNLPLAEQVLSTMAKALKKPLTVKFRIGFTDDAINVVEFAKMAEASGVASVTIHGRTREQYYRGKANWQYIKEAKEAVKIPVFGNGDIFQEEDALAMLLSTGVDGVALARGIQGNPFLIRACVSLLSEGKKLPPVSLSERKEMMLRHLKLMVEIKGEHLALLEMRKHLSWYMEGLENAARWRQRVNTENDLEKVFQMVREL